MGFEYKDNFKRDKKPIIDMVFKTIGQIGFVGNFIAPLKKELQVEEVRFDKTEIVLIRDQEIHRYNYKRINATVSHSKNKFLNTRPCIRVELRVKRGCTFSMDLTSKCAGLFSQNFTNHHRDFLYQVVKCVPRTKEKSFEQKQSYPVMLFGVISVLFVLMEFA